VVKLVPTRLSFGTLNQCRNASQTITLTNIGSTALTIGGIQVTPESRQAFAQTNNCGSTVAAGKSCTVTVTFSTGGLVGIPPGSYTDSVVISDNGGGGSEGIPLSGSVRLCHECCF
jgi:trimeric autotransporter adhesin